MQDLHSAEADTVEVLPLVVDAATSPDPKRALDEHRARSREQARRLERIGETLGKEAKRPTSLWAGA